MKKQVKLLITNVEFSIINASTNIDRAFYEDPGFYEVTVPIDKLRNFKTEDIEEKLREAISDNIYWDVNNTDVDYDIEVHNFTWNHFGKIIDSE